MRIWEGANGARKSLSLRAVGQRRTSSVMRVVDRLRTVITSCPEPVAGRAGLTETRTLCGSSAPGSGSERDGSGVKLGSSDVLRLGVARSLTVANWLGLADGVAERNRVDRQALVDMARTSSAISRGARWMKADECITETGIVREWMPSRARAGLPDSLRGTPWQSAAQQGSGPCRHMENGGIRGESGGVHRSMTHLDGGHE